MRFVEDDWENPTLGAWGLGWEVWLNGMEITQFTYFQQVGGLDCNPITGEITYGLERLAMYLQGKENVFDLVWTRVDRATASTRQLTYGDVYHQNEVEQSTYNFEQSNAPKLFELFAFFESRGEAPARSEAAAARLRDDPQGRAHVQPARRARRDLGDRARRRTSAASATLSRQVAQAYVESREALGFPMLPDAPARAHDGEPCSGDRSDARERARRVATLVVELVTEELPPKALKRLGEAFADAHRRGARSRAAVLDRQRRSPRRTRRRAGSRSRSRTCAPSRPTPRSIDKLMPRQGRARRGGQADRGAAQEARRARPRHLADARRSMRGDGPDQLYVESDGKADYVYLRSLAKGQPLARGAAGGARRGDRAACRSRR